MAALSEPLISLGRTLGLFHAGQGVDHGRDTKTAWAIASDYRQGDYRGIAVTREGQRSAWISLPGDMLGSVFDPDDIRQRIEDLLRVVVEVPIPDVTLAPAAVIEAASLLSEGTVSSIGTRSSASPKMWDGGVIVADPEGALELADIRAYRGDVAEELAARLYALFRERR